MLVLLFPGLICGWNIQSLDSTISMSYLFNN